MSIRVQFRRGSELNWSNANPVLAQGEIGYNTENNRFKIGDGLRSWDNLPYVSSGGTGSVTTVTAGTGLIGGTISTSGTLAIDKSIVMTLGTRQLLLNKTLKSPLESLTRIDHQGGTLQLDLSISNDFYIRLDGNITNFEFINLDYEDSMFGFRIFFESTGINLISWPINCFWPNGTPPILSGTGKIDIITILTYDNGASYFGTVEAKNLTI